MAGAWKTCRLVGRQLGLCLLVVAYALLGAGLFQAIELPHEMTFQGHLEEDMEETVEELWDFVRGREVVVEREVRGEAERLLKALELRIIDAARREGYSGNDRTEYQWTFSGSLLYAVTVFSTIGYGHICPKTGLGRATTVVYATVGIPLMLLCLAYVADSMANLFGWLYFRLCCAYCRWDKRRRMLNRAALTLRPAFPAPIHQPPSRPKAPSPPPAPPAKPPPIRITGLPFQFRSRTSLLSQASSGESGRAAVLHLLRPAPLVLASERGRSSSTPSRLDSLSEAAAEAVELASLRVLAVRRGALRRGRSEDGLVSQAQRLPEWDFERLMVRRKRLPTSLGLICVVAFLWLGAVVFALWEGWSFMDGAYYSFITLSTIGFGDMVPGESMSGGGEIFCSVYLLLGMAIIAMAFKLIQEDVVAKAHYIGSKIGLLSMPQSSAEDTNDIFTYTQPDDDSDDSFDSDEPEPVFLYSD